MRKKEIILNLIPVPSDDIESIGFKVNPYDPCVANRIVKG